MRIMHANTILFGTCESIDINGVLHVEKVAVNQEFYYDSTFTFHNTRENLYRILYTYGELIEVNVDIYLANNNFP